MTKQRKLVVCASVVPVVWVLLAGQAVVQAHGAERGNCAGPGKGVVAEHTRALCRSLAHKAETDSPGKYWSASWADRCSGVSDTRSRCTFRLVFRDRSEPKADRRPSRVCRGQATVIGRTHFRVKYDGGCVYPDAYRTGGRS